MSRHLTRPTNRRPFFEIGGRWYVDLLFNFDEPLAVTSADLENFLTAVDSRRIIVARQLSETESEMLLASRRSSDGELHSRLVPDGALRWLRPPGRR
jgi:hypothetical protein